LRSCALLVWLVVLGSLGSALAQTPSRQLAPRTPEVVDTCSIRRTCIINPVFATGMKCDGTTDDSAALQAALNSAVNAGLGNATIIMPPGTCIIDPAAGVSINSGVWLQGAGKYGTTLKRKNSSSGSPIVLLNSNSVTLSDFAIDGNKGGPGIATPADSVAAGIPLSMITIQRMRFVNSTNSDIASYVSGAGNFTVDWTVADNVFENQANPVASCVLSMGCGNMFIHQPLRLRVMGNRSDNSENFALLSSIPGGGQVDIGENTVSNLGGFAIALGGGAIGSSGAHIHHNFITSNSTDPYNLVDLAIWSDFSVDHNTIYHNGITPSNTSVASCCIADFPPADKGEVDSNICHAARATGLNVVGIGLGGSDISVTNNYVEGGSSAGIGIAVSFAGPAKRVTVIGNTTKNNNQQNPGHHAGIELFINPSSPSLGALSDVIVRGNHSYDDQPVKTQGYGIGVALFGQPTGFNNILIEGNDVTGNAVAGIQNFATTYSGFVIRNNLGFNPVGVLGAPDFPASGAPLTNSTGYDATIYITSGTNPIAVAINGTGLTGATVQGGGAVSSPVRLPANQNITLTYATGGTPSWQWIGE
jgi:hypothetical protein